MYAALTFDEKMFPGMTNIGLWLANQTGETVTKLGDLAVRGKYAVAYCRGRKCNFVYRLADIKGGNVPKLADCKAGDVLDQGVTAYAVK
jgi:hypothetical protein